MLLWIQQQLKKNKKTIALSFTCALVFFVFFFGVNNVSAQANVQDGDVFGTSDINENIALGNQSLIKTVVRIINILLGLLGIIALGIVLYGGFVYMTSGGSDDKVATARKILINGVIGLVIILSAWTITAFILRSLGDATDVRGLAGGRGGGGPFEGFAGSSALGRLVRDHYPTRGQIDVKRNIRIAVTFYEPIDPSSLINNTNQTCWSAEGKPTTQCQRDGDKILNPYYGDCVTPPGQAFDWARDCDTLKTDAVGIFATTTNKVFDLAAGRWRRKANLPVEPAAAYALASYSGGAERDALVFVFKPVNFLGDNLKKVDYTVELSSVIKKKNGEDAFGNKPYIWNFQTDTAFDFEAPRILFREPNPNATIPRNRIVQVIFSEPMDPIAARGALSASSSFFNIIFGNRNIEGEWELPNGYQTAEFTPSLPCGENSCGETMYCLPVECEEGAAEGSCFNDAEILLRTARPQANNSFEAHPGTGLTDMAGNALDGNGDRQVDGKPNMPGDFKTIGKVAPIDERVADNSYWQFRISNAIDRTPPVIEEVSPRVDSEGVKKDELIKILFNEPMWHSTFRGIGLEEYPRDDRIDDIWFRSVAQREEGKDTAVIEHREFGPNGLDFFYFPTVSSSVRDLSQNCLYPGRGPLPAAKGGQAVCSVGVNGAQNCVPVESISDRDTGCAQTTNAGTATAQPDVKACVRGLEQISQRPVPAPDGQ